MRVVRYSLNTALTALALSAGSTDAFAQSNDEVFPQFQFDFSTPGARANAMGRTFIGIADDSSASITNPAGLTRLARQQFYFEFKNTELEVERLASDPFADRLNQASFVSFSSPIGERLTVAFTRHEFLNHRETFSLGPRPIPPQFAFVFFPVDGRSDFSAVSYAGSVAVTVTPKLRIGLTLSADRLRAKAVATRFNFARAACSIDQGAGGGCSTEFERTDTIANRTEIDETAGGVSTVIGALVVPHEALTIGFQFAKGATFEVEERLSGNPLFPTPSTQLVLADGFPKTVTINVPDRLGVGISARPLPRLLVAADFVRIGYSSLAQDFTLIFNAGELTGSNFKIADASEYHVGAEYLVLAGERRVFVRAGFYTSPDHRAEFIPSPTADPSTNDEEVAKYNLLPRDTDLVGSVGAGIAVGPRFQVDVAYLVGREFVASLGLRF